jgi:hypothetical protein
LLARIAEVIGLAPQRLQELWGAGGAKPFRVSEAPTTAQPRARQRRAQTRTSAGRGTLVRQAVLMLARFPAVASEVSEQERAGLDASEEPGIAFLRELLDDLRAHPAQISAQVVERWAGRPESDWLQKLLQREEIVADAAAAAGELKQALAKLADLVPARRLEALEAKSRTTALEPEELEELKEIHRLKMRKAPRDARGG